MFNTFVMLDLTVSVLSHNYLFTILLGNVQIIVGMCVVFTIYKKELLFL